ncbi:MAG: hypothetical protein QW757_04575 [Candidatus Woesearchaeota archaeon]
MIYFDRFRLRLLFLLVFVFMLGVFTTITFSYLIEDKSVKQTTTIIEKAQDGKL